MDEMKKLAALAYELREDVVNGRTYRRGYERHGYSGVALF